MGEFVRVEFDTATRVATLRLDRPPMNALSLQVWRDIEECAADLDARPEVGAVVVTGGPKVFAAGADITEFPDWDAPHVMEVVAPQLHRAADRIAGLAVPTIAVINGYALGGGCELALACDFRFAADNAKMGQPEVLLGILPGAGGTQRLPLLVGPARAKELIFSGRIVTMTEAAAIGLVDVVEPVDDLQAAATGAAIRYAAGPYALRLAKRAINAGIDTALTQGLQRERSLFAQAFATDDRQAGIASFLEHGPGQATFTGR